MGLKLSRQLMGASSSSSTTARSPYDHGPMAFYDSGDWEKCVVHTEPATEVGDKFERKVSPFSVASDATNVSMASRHSLHQGRSPWDHGPLC
mmetsp:Transcript_2867/g.8053  ORF Transcript_2867/g.8053 Transcript_2867/m.8053 type:complete len:92 (+) Transcript_2867:107-382(+)